MSIVSVPTNLTEKGPASPGCDNFSVRGYVMFATCIMAALVFAVSGWAAKAKLTGAIVASGTFVVEKNVKKVQHSFGGIVSEIKVRNGDRVEGGQVLMRLDSTQIRAELGIIDSQITELTARTVRLAAERENQTQIKMPESLIDRGGDSKTAAEGEVRLFEENLRTRQSQKEQLSIRIEQLREEINGLSAQRDAKRDELSIIALELDQASQLHKKSLAPISRVYAMQREMKRLSGEHGGLVAQIARALGQISEIKVQLLSVDENARAQAQREHRSMEAKLAELTERSIATMDKLNRLEIRAPQSGSVHELTAHTVGGIITAAEQIMLVVPDEDTLVVQARIAPNDVDQAVVAREARLRLTAFSQQETPELKGRLVSVSADVTLDPKNGLSYYMARLEMEDKAKRSIGNLPLLPGMPVEVYISTGERTALSYLLKPFVDQMGRAFRE